MNNPNGWCRMLGIWIAQILSNHWLPRSLWLAMTCDVILSVNLGVITVGIAAHLVDMFQLRYRRFLLWEARVRARQNI